MSIIISVKLLVKSPQTAKWAGSFVADEWIDKKEIKKGRPFSKLITPSLPIVELVNLLVISDLVYSFPILNNWVGNNSLAIYLFL